LQVDAEDTSSVKRKSRKVAETAVQVKERKVQADIDKAGVASSRARELEKTAQHSMQQQPKQQPHQHSFGQGSAEFTGSRLGSMGGNIMGSNPYGNMGGNHYSNIGGNHYSMGGNPYGNMGNMSKV
jgi:hypothetical protein